MPRLIRKGLPIQQQLPQPEPQPDILERLGQGVISFGKTMAKPVVDYGQMLAGGLIQAPIVAASGGRVDPRNIPLLGKMFMPETGLEKFAEPKRGLIEGVKRTAAFMPYAIPAGQSWKAAAGLGGVQGALSSIGMAQEGESGAKVLGRVLMGAGLGAGSGLAFRGISNIMGRMAGRTSQIPLGLQKSFKEALDTMPEGASKRMAARALREGKIESVTSIIGPYLKNIDEGAYGQAMKLTQLAGAGQADMLETLGVKPEAPAVRGVTRAMYETDDLLGKLAQGTLGPDEGQKLINLPLFKQARKKSLEGLSEKMKDMMERKYSEVAGSGNWKGYLMSIHKHIPGWASDPNDMTGLAKMIHTATLSADELGTAWQSAAKPAAIDLLSGVGKVGKTPNIAERAWLSAFTVPTKLGKRLKLQETARAMLKHNVTGSLDDMATTVGKVTGPDGAVTKLTRHVIGSIKDEVPIDDAYNSARNMIAGSLAIDDATGNKLLAQIASKTPTGKGIGRINALDAYDFAKGLEKLGYQFKSRSTYLTGRMADEQAGSVYLAVADELMDALDRAAGKSGTHLIETFKTPEVITQLAQISPLLAEQFKKTSSIPGLRSLAADFVRLGRMIDLTNAAETSAFNKLARSLTTSSLPGITKGLVSRTVGSPWVATKAAQKMSTVGRMGGAAGQIISGLAGKVSPEMLDITQRLAPIAAVRGIGGGEALEPTEIMPPVSGTAMAAPSVGELTAGIGGQAAPRDYFGVGAPTAKPMMTAEQAMMMMMLAPKQASTIKAMYQMSEKAAGGVKLNTFQQKAVAGGNAALQMLDDMESQYGQVQQQGLTARVPIVGALRGMAGGFAAATQLSPEAAAYNDSKGAFLSLLSRGLGESGVLNDKDIERVRLALPDFYDTVRTAELKMSNIRGIINAKIQAILAPVYQTSPLSGIDILGGLLQ